MDTVLKILFRCVQRSHTRKGSMVGRPKMILLLYTYLNGKIGVAIRLDSQKYDGIRPVSACPTRGQLNRENEYSPVPVRA